MVISLKKKKLKIDLAYDPAILLLSIDPEYLNIFIKEP